MHTCAPFSCRYQLGGALVVKRTTMQRDFKGIWIPAEIWLDDSLSALDKIIFAEIDSLDNEDGCFASNEYLAGFCQCSVSKVSTAISRLKERGYVEAVSFDGRRRILKSCLLLSKRQTIKNKKAGKQNLKAINKASTKDIKKERVGRPTLDDVIGFMRESGASDAYAERFYQHYESQGWRKGNGLPIENWHAAAWYWLKKDGIKPKKSYPAQMICKCGGKMHKTASTQSGTDVPYYKCSKCGERELYR